MPQSQRCPNRGTVGHKAGEPHSTPGAGPGELGQAFQVEGLAKAKACGLGTACALWEPESFG